MKERHGLSLARFWAMIVKEFIQMRRDRLTFGMMIGIPLVQLVLFGFAINSDPKHMAAAVLVADYGPQGRTLLYAIQNSSYFDFVREVGTEREARDVLARGEVQFVVNIPESFTRDLLRGDRPSVLVEADATDPGATGIALGSLNALMNTAFRNDLKGPLAYLAATPGPIDVRVHALYNPESITQYNIVPGLMGVVLTMTMAMITGLAITREILFVARFLFHVPMVGSLTLLLATALVFIAANLSMGITFSTIAKNQRQAMQMAVFYFLPSILLSGFMFPFRGMPRWAQWVGEILPLTHFLRVVRGILLKGNGLPDVTRELWPIVLFAVVALTVAVKRYRQTLD
jgi:ABC-2 type transport system permease protein